MLWRYQGRLSHDLTVASHVFAGVFNAQRTKRSDKWYTADDFHPLASPQRRNPSGRQLNGRYTAHLLATGQEIEWLTDD